MSNDEVLSAAMRLPPKAREELANTLLDSLYPANAEGFRGFSSTWAQELKARVKALEEGRVASVPAGDALNQIRERLKRRAG